MKKTIKKSSYIIGFRRSNEERMEALLYVLTWLRTCFPSLEIIVVEQDEQPRLTFDSALNIRQVFFKNGGIYNHSKGYNEGAKVTDKQFLIFATADIFLSKNDFLTCFELAEKFEAITPNRIELTNVAIPDSVNFDFVELSKEPLYTFAGGILFIQKQAFEKAGGWDERLVGWGGDDNAMSHVIYQKLSSKTLNVPMYHIEHPRGKADGKSQDRYAENRIIIDEINTFFGATLERYCELLRIENGFQKPLTNKNKKPNFVLAVTTFNRLIYLKRVCYKLRESIIKLEF